MQAPALVQLDADHPGFRDPHYRARRDAIARLARVHLRGRPVPDVEYTSGEDLLWARLYATLRRMWRRHACAEILDVVREMPLPRERVPQLEEVNRRLRARSEFRMEPVAGLIEAEGFLRALGERVFLSTQYIRHVSKPLYTPEPDVVHEMLGHAASLAHPAIARLSVAFGEAAREAGPRRIAELERLYWYTLEYGLVREGDAIKALGAGILSSAGECRRFARHARLLEFDPGLCARSDYDPTHYQPRLFVAPSFAELSERTLAWLSESV